jgi:hypothetical protein
MLCLDSARDPFCPVRSFFPAQPSAPEPGKTSAWPAYRRAVSSSRRPFLIASLYAFCATWFMDLMLYLRYISQKNDQFELFCSFFSCQKTLNRLIVPLIKDCSFRCKAITVTGQQRMG